MVMDEQILTGKGAFTPSILAQRLRAPSDTTTDAASHSFYLALSSILALSAILVLVFAYLTPTYPSERNHANGSGRESKKERAWLRRIGRGRAIHAITAATILTASIAYANLASLTTPSPSSTPTWRPNHTTTRYTDWFITTPLLLLDLLLLSGMTDMGVMFRIVAADEVMLLSGLLTSKAGITEVKWGSYAIGCASLVYVVTKMYASVSRTLSSPTDMEVRRIFVGLGGFLAIIWVFYPIIWAVAELGVVNTEDNGGVGRNDGFYYGVLDLLAKPVFGFWILFAHRGIGLERMRLMTAEEGPEDEKEEKKDGAVAVKEVKEV
ncbi:hypothetical protein YB2330_006001 [Saitoella coloradoensis]